MTRGLAELVDDLERVSTISNDEFTTARIQQMLDERQEIIDAIQTTDRSTLPVDVRQNLEIRIAAVAANDAHLRTAIEMNMALIRAELDKIVTSRQAVHGYRPGAFDQTNKRFKAA